MDPAVQARLEEALKPESLGRLASHEVYLWMLRVAVSGMNMIMDSTQESGELLALTLIRTEFLRRGVRGPYVFFDVGSSIGEISEALVDIFGDGSIIHAFEPSAWAYQYFAGRADELGLKNIVLNNFALGAEPGRATLYAKSEGHQTGSLYHRQTRHLEDSGAVREVVEIRTIDDYCEAHGIAHIHFLKIDVEGHELAVLQGAARLLEAGGIDFIQFEFGSTNMDSRTFFKDFWTLLNPRYEIMRILRDGVFRIPEYEEILEIFEWQNFLAVRRL